MLKLIFFFLIIASVVHAQTVEEILKTTLDSKAVDCPPESAALSCATELCGPASGEKSLYSTNERFLYGGEKNFQEQDKRLADIEKKMRVHIQSMNENVDKLLTKINTGSFDINFEKWPNFDLFSTEFEVFQQYISTKSDTSKPLSDRITMDIRYPETMSLEEKQELTAYAERMKKDYLQKPSLLIRYRILTKDESLSEINRLWKEIAKYHLSPAIKAIWDEKLSGIKTQEEITGFYNELTALHERLTGNRTKPESTLYCKDPSCIQMMKSAVAKKYKKKLDALVKKIQKVSYTDGQIKDAAKTCLANNILRNDMNQKADMFEKNIPQVIENFISQGMKNFSAHSKSVFREYLKSEVKFNIKYQKPPELSSLLTELQEGNDAETILLVAKDMVDQPFSSMEDCHLPYNKSDRVISAKDKLEVELSYFTCSNAGTGTSLLAHELGHILSYSIAYGYLSPESKDHFLKARECISSRYKKFPGPAQSAYAHGNDHLLSEEDQADFMAKATYPEGPLFSCSLLNQNIDRTSYEVDLRATGEEHSNSFLRLVWEATMRNKIPPKSCVDTFLKEQDFDVKSCLEFK